MATFTGWWSLLPEAQREEQFKAIAAGGPAGRIGTAGDVAEAIGYLVGARLVTGTIRPADGGFTVA